MLIVCNIFVFINIFIVHVVSLWVAIDTAIIYNDRGRVKISSNLRMGCSPASRRGGGGQLTAKSFFRHFDPSYKNAPFATHRLNTYKNEQKYENTYV